MLCLFVRYVREKVGIGFYKETRVRSTVNTTKFTSALNEHYIYFVYTVMMCKLLNRHFFVNLFIVYFLVLTSFKDVQCKGKCTVCPMGLELQFVLPL